MNRIDIGQQMWVYRQPGGCTEIGQWEDDRKRDNDVIHVCDAEDVRKLIDALTKMLPCTCHGHEPSIHWCNPIELASKTNPGGYR